MIDVNTPNPRIAASLSGVVASPVPPPVRFPLEPLTSSGRPGMDIPLHTLEPGQSLLVPYDGEDPKKVMKNVDGNVRYFGRRRGTWFTCRRQEEGVRVWRLGRPGEQLPGVPNVGRRHALAPSQEVRHYAGPAILIEEGIPLPVRTFLPGVRRYPFHLMVRGDSFLMPETDDVKAEKLVWAMRSAVNRWDVRPEAEGRFECHRVPGGVRCWRVS